ncbi:cytochrome P450 monooxygenase-like protein [Lindgomyces ingoldianus]|uniref:Cytochrome P450 monooxygenase-like protein n=1 Tax=Lindgomyces ingoldianus TaxID=673940 RepID=A0ACB6QDE0_9PLEO|nr:cytochrome P450 monooxygenase-like protein [Lindgomyces ingoldianus]KAF2464865.1 cytochrome P450 monooxygenase-like protein [Lindgomyces ingoldianus]
MMENQSLVGLSYTLQTAVVAAIIFAVSVFLSKINFRSQLAQLPPYGNFGEKGRVEYLKSAKNMYLNGYQQFKDTVYRMYTSDGNETIVIAPKFLPELRNLPDKVLNFPEAVREIMEQKYTKILTDTPLVTHTIRADLTPALARLNPIICAEVDEAIKDEMPPCNDWTPVSIYTALVHIVAKVSGRVFVGPDLCHNEEYLDCGINYTMELISAQQAIKKTRPILRPFFAPRLPEVKRLRERERIAKAFLEPIIDARRVAENNDPDWQRPDDMLQWFLNRSEDFGNFSAHELAKFQLGIIFAAIHTTTLTATNILYTLAISPEYITPLREEIRTCMADNGGIITSRALQQMEKLDSFMKECVRFNPPGFTSFSRKVLQGITLSNGQHIPAGSTLEVPAHAIYHDSQFYPDHEKFDGFRFAKLRKGGTAADIARNQFVTSNEQSLSFGYGRHACPGRFFATNEIKMILSRLVLEYDVRNMDGVMERYPNMEVGRSTSPDPTKNLMFKKVEV